MRVVSVLDEQPVTKNRDMVNIIARSVRVIFSSKWILNGIISEDCMLIESAGRGKDWSGILTCSFVTSFP